MLSNVTVFIGVFGDSIWPQGRMSLAANRAIKRRRRLPNWLACGSDLKRLVSKEAFLFGCKRFLRTAEMATRPPDLISRSHFVLCVIEVISNAFTVLSLSLWPLRQTIKRFMIFALKPITMQWKNSLPGLMADPRTATRVRASIFTEDSSATLTGRLMSLGFEDFSLRASNVASLQSKVWPQ